MRKTVMVTGLMALILLQYHLWDPAGVPHMLHLQKVLSHAEEINETLRIRNERLAADVKALQDDPEVTQTHAREDFGMIKPGETFYQMSDT
jgi:cell division protein FtsB